ncbi:uncharacterized protein LOC116180128 isoform X3 [Photinus pyralis]|uniref:uncharacterized protein LOC116180128 isoform X3 n=1 Tax=Photinus pyralis TaxID=7054 RepID=UPI0012674D54|nr:uncharacterized protein LOC116180128 isoform X3 [Photinus pyralis]
MLGQLLAYAWVVLCNMIFKRSTSGCDERVMRGLVVLSYFVWDNMQRRKLTEKMELVPVEDKMNQVAAMAPSVIGNVVESEINTDEESTSTEISKDTDTSKYEEQREDYEAQGSAKIVGTSGTTSSAASAKSSDAKSREEYSEGNRKEEEPEVAPASKPPPEAVEDKPKETSPAPTSTPTTPQPSQVKPFEPIKPFEPLQPLEPPKSFEIAKQLESEAKALEKSTASVTSQNGEEDVQKEEKTTPTKEVAESQSKAVPETAPTGNEAKQAESKGEEKVVPKEPSTDQPDASTPSQPKPKERESEPVDQPAQPQEIIKDQAVAPTQQTPSDHPVEPPDPPKVHSADTQPQSTTSQPAHPPDQAVDAPPSAPTQPDSPNVHSAEAQPQSTQPSSAESPSVDTVPSAPTQQTSKDHPVHTPDPPKVHSVEVQPQSTPASQPSGPESQTVDTLTSAPTEQTSKDHPVHQPDPPKVHSAEAQPQSAPPVQYSGPQTQTVHTVPSAPAQQTSKDHPVRQPDPPKVHSAEAQPQSTPPVHSGPQTQTVHTVPSTPTQQTSPQNQIPQTKYQPITPPQQHYIPVAPQAQISATTQTQRPSNYPPSAFRNVPMSLLAEPPQPKVPLQPFNAEPTFQHAESKIYQPILRKSPIFVPVQEHSTSHKSEIKEEKIKDALKEIISEIDTYAAKDRELRSADGSRRMNESEKVYNFEKSSTTYGTQRCTDELRESYSTYASSDYAATLDENVASPINLEKIFTPAHDAPQIAPQKKMFASSDFYAKGLHPTMEEQVELARRISSSLSDATNQTSKGQSMYVNRKKRSVKWVHEGEGQANGAENGFGVEGHDENKPLLQLVMNPRGKLQDIYSLRKQGYSIDATLSPEFCQEIVRDLNSPRGKGAELFAKRRKKSEKWVVGETEGTRGSYEPPPTPKPILIPVLPPNHLPTPSYLPETAQRAQHNQKLDQIQEQFVRPRVKLIKSPWDAALETGSVEAAFEDLPPVWPKRGAFVRPTVDSYEQAMKSHTLESWDGTSRHTANPAYNSNSINRMVDHFQKGTSNIDVYKPVLPRAWNAQAPPVQQYSSIASPVIPEPEVTRSPSPFPTIPDVTLETPKPESPVLPPARPASPFVCIPDVQTNLDLLTDDIHSFQDQLPLISSLDPPMSFPTIPNIELNPEIIERDIVTLRTTPIPFPSREPSPEREPEIVPNPSPFPMIPDFSLQNAPRPFTRGLPTRTYAPVSLTGKRYPLHPEPRPATPVEKPEFNFASDPEQKVIEREFDDASNVHTLQGELFESMGHYNASETRPPLPVFVPKDERSFSERVRDQFERQVNVQYAQLSDESEVKKMLVKMKHVQFGIDNLPCDEPKPLETPPPEEPNEPIETEPEPVQELDLPQEVMKPIGVLPPEIAELVVKTEPNHIEITRYETKKDLNVEKRGNFEIESPKCKKPPSSVAGARPLFGQMDINAEFKKALGRKSRSEPKVKIRRSEVKNEQELGDGSKLSSQLTTKEVAEIRTIAKTDDEEIDQIFYEKEREVEMDLQVKREELVMPDGTVIPIASSVRVEYPPRHLLRGDTNKLSDDLLVESSKQMIYAQASHDDDEEMYRKVPVRHLIQSFEESAMPPMRYKQIKDVTVVQSVMGDQIVQQTTQHEQLLRQAEEDFENLYTVTNTTTEGFQRSSIPDNLALAQEPPSSPLPQSRRAPTYKPEPPPAVFVPRETTTPTYEIYNINQSTPPPPPRKYGSFVNYNTAPRGWGQSAVYKPISYADYSDF